MTLPIEIFEIRDHIVDSVYFNKPMPAEINLLYEWLESEGWDSLISGPDSMDYLAINTDSLNDQLTENECRDYEALEEDEPVTDLHKLSFTRSILEHISENNDCLSILTYRMNDYKLERAAIVGCVIYMQGQLDPDISWWGGYINDEVFLKELREKKLFVLQGDEFLSDEEILSLWEKK